MTRYVVIGAGAVGGLLAAQLELAGIRTVLVARGQQLDALRANGLRVRRPHGDDVVRLETAAGPDEVRLSTEDVLVLATKAQDADAALTTWAWQPVGDGSLGADLPILTLQNGLSTEEAALRRFRRVYGVTVGVAASYLVPGEVVSPSYPLVGVAWLGRYPDREDPAQETYVRDLTAAGFGTRGVADISAWKARKLLGNVRNALDLLDGTAEEKTRLGALLVAEAEAVFAAAGIVAAGDADALRGGWEARHRTRAGPRPGPPVDLAELRPWHVERGRPPQRRDRAARAPPRRPDTGQRTGATPARPARTEGTDRCLARCSPTGRAWRRTGRRSRSCAPATSPTCNAPSPKPAAPAPRW